MIRRVILILLALVWAVLAAAGPACGSGEAGPVARAELKQFFSERVKSGLSLPPGGEVEIVNFATFPEPLVLPGGERTFKVVSRSQAGQFGRQTLVVMALVNGEEQGQVRLSGDLVLYGQALAATRPLERNTVLTAGDVSKARRNLSALGPDVVTDPALAVGKELTTSLQPGAAIYGRFLKEPALVKRGDIVTILALTDSLRVSVPGRALDQAGKGEQVRVKNLMSRREVYAKVLAPDLVLVGR